jgi:RNA polymerase sigma-70 factor (ECF subfamily)
VGRRSDSPHQQGPAAQHGVGTDRHWRSGMTWPPDLPFAVVLQRARQRDQQAISALYKRFLPVVYRYVLARVDDPHLAEDLTADTFFALVKDIGSARASDELAFSAWVLSIARSKVAQHFRRQHTRTNIEREMAPAEEPQTSNDEDDPLAIITARESWGTVATALSRLTEEQRAVVLYRCVLEYSAEEVADLLGKQPGTIRALQFRALASLARHLGIAKGGRQASHTRPGAEGHYPPPRQQPGQPGQPGRNGDADRR